MGVQRPIRNDCCRKTNTVIGRDTAAVSRRLALGRRGGGPVNGMGAWKPVESAQSEEREPPDFQPPSMWSDSLRELKSTNSGNTRHLRLYPTLFSAKVSSCKSSVSWTKVKLHCLEKTGLLNGPGVRVDCLESLTKTIKKSWHDECFSWIYLHYTREKSRLQSF